MTRIEEEKKTVEQMIRLYCRLKEGNETLCEECSALLEYAHKRLDHCKFGDQKRLVGNARYIAINRFFERKCVRSCDLLVLE